MPSTAIAVGNGMRAVRPPLHRHQDGRRPQRRSGIRRVNGVATPRSVRAGGVLNRSRGVFAGGRWYLGGEYVRDDVVDEVWGDGPVSDEAAVEERSGE